MFEDFFSGITDLMDGAGDYAAGILGEAAGIQNSWDNLFGDNADSNSNASSNTQQQPTYDPNITASDIFAQPNYTLLFGGLALLIVALWLMKR